MFTWRPSSSIRNSFSMLFIHSAFLLWSFHSHILLQNLTSLASGCWYGLTHSTPLIVVRIFFVVLERSVLAIWFGFVSVSFSSPFFRQYFWLIFSNFIFRCSCRAFSVSSKIFLMFCFCILVCCRSLFICDSSQSSHPDFDFLSVILKGTPILSQINFAPVYIKSFTSVISFVGIFINKSFTFSVSNLTVLYSWFLREGMWFSFQTFFYWYLHSFFFFLSCQCLHLYVCNVRVVVI